MRNVFEIGQMPSFVSSQEFPFNNFSLVEQQQQQQFVPNREDYTINNNVKFRP